MATVSVQMEVLMSAKEKMGVSGAKIVRLIPSLLGRKRQNCAIACHAGIGC